MADPKLEQVFQVSGVPTHTFVEPTEYTKLLVSLRTPGRGVVIEGPSGIGKTSAVETAIKKLGTAVNVTKLSARKPADIEYIESLPSLGDVGLVIVDDFHRLEDGTKQHLADYLKTLADEGRPGVKIVAVGINKAGDRLINFASDLVNRIDIIRFETNPDYKISELLEKGEMALNVKINVSEEIIATAHGSFYLAQLLAHEVCIKSHMDERSDEFRITKVSFEAISAAVWDRLSLRFDDPCRAFCRGTRMNSMGRAPYLQILRLLGTGQEWTLSLREAMRKHPQFRGSIGQVVEKKFLKQVFQANPSVREILHYDEGSSMISVEDPQLVFYLRNMPWSTFARDLGFVRLEFGRRYDFALSFAGADRDIALEIANLLRASEVEVFYDKYEQNRILAEDIEEYLRPIYQSEALFVICLLGKEYPSRIWTKFESDAFKERFRTGSVIPIWFADAPPGMFDESRRVGGITFDRSQPIRPQVQEIVSSLLEKLEDQRPEPPPPPQMSFPDVK
jgi:hypothetical protein